NSAAPLTQAWAAWDCRRCRPWGRGGIPDLGGRESRARASLRLEARARARPPSPLCEQWNVCGDWRWRSARRLRHRHGDRRSGRASKATRSRPRHLIPDTGSVDPFLILGGFDEDRYLRLWTDSRHGFWVRPVDRHETERELLHESSWR